MKRLSYLVPGADGDFLKFWAGQSISNLGNAASMFALPLIIYKLTGSAVNLGIASAVAFVPYLLFGLIIGAWVDRVDRKRLMIWTDILRALVFGVIAVLALTGELQVWWVYAAGFLNSTLSIAFDAAQFAAIPSLVDTNDIVTANGRIQATFSAATVLGPLIGGAIVAIASPEAIFAADGLTFLLSALSLALIRRSFNTAEREEKTSIRSDVVEGLRYVLHHPVLRQISLMMAIINLISSTYYAQIVLFAHQRLDASDAQVALLFAVDSLGVVIISLFAGTFRKRWAFGAIMLGSLMIQGVLWILFALNTSYLIALPIWAISGGFGILFNINSGSLRQSIVPNHMLGRVMTIAGVLAWSAVPIGTITGGILIERTGAIVGVYVAIGVATTLIAALFALGPLGHSDRYLPATNPAADQIVA